MAVRRHGKNRSTEYGVNYSGMHGVDFSPEPSAMKRYRFSELENMYRDYEGGGAGITESIPGFRKIISLGKRINSIFSYKDSAGDEYLVIHSESSLYRFAISERDKIGTLTSLIEMKDTRSRAFTSGDDLYILDGEHIIRVSGDGGASYVSESGVSPPYIPTTYYNGTEYEQRNLLTNKFIEKYIVNASSEIAVGSDGLKYRITSQEERKCAVAGIDGVHGGSLYIPSQVDIAGIKYTVTEVEQRAFYQNTAITEVILSDTVEYIGKMAFYGCINIKRVVTRSCIKEIDNNAFFACDKLTTVYIGIGIERIGVRAFESCFKITEFNYAGTANEFALAMQDFDFSSIGVTPIYNTIYTDIMIEIPVFSPAVTISSVKVNKTGVAFTTKTQNSLICAILINGKDRADFDGKEIHIEGVMSPTRFTPNSTGRNFISESGSIISGFDAITGCTVCESFDGRVFLSGNPRLPNTVFYTARDQSGRNNPRFFGILNYFNDGIGSFKVESMLASGDSLAIFKSGDDGCGSIYYHTAKSTGSDILPVIYPVTYVHSGIHAVGESISFFDDPIFISPLGVSALGKKNINLERSISVRSHNVNPKLLAEDLSKISLTKWCGYLVVSANGHIYLADSRDTFTHETGNIEYEWYYLNGIGTCSGTEKIFRYSDVSRYGYEIHKDAGEIIKGEIHAESDGNGGLKSFTYENGKKYEIYSDGERRGGIFSPASVIYATANDLMFFGTESGDVCIFNNDMRGKPPSHLELSESDIEEYRTSLGKRLHHTYYSFNFKAPRYLLSTVFENGGFANYEKNTVKNSLTAKVRLIGNGSFTCEVGTEEGEYTEVGSFPDSGFCFAELDFSRISFSGSEYITIPFKEREKGWIEKKISFFTEEYNSPFGICNIGYRFKIKGKIKN